MLNRRAGMIRLRAGLGAWLLLTIVLGTAGPLVADGPPAALTDDERKELLEQRNRLWNEAQELESKGKLGEAVAAVLRMIRIEETLLGLDDSEVAVSSEYLATLHLAGEDFAAAREARRQVLRIKRKLFGEDHWQTNDARRNLAEVDRLSHLQGAQRTQLQQADELAQRAVALYREGKYQQAIPIAERVVNLKRAVLGQMHVDYATSLSNLGFLRRATGDNAQAEKLYRQASEIWKKVLGEDHPDYATSLNNLGGVYQAMGDYARAEPLFHQTTKIRKRTLGEEHPDYATSLNNFATLCEALGDYARAEPLYRQASEIWKKVLGDEHPDYARSLNNLGSVHQALGDYARAEQFYRQALEVWKKAFGEEHPEYARGLNNLGAVFEAMGDYAQAEKLYRQASEIWKKVLGEDHPDYATSLNNLGGVYKVLGDYARAEQLYREALELLKKTLGVEHPHYGACLSNLARVYEAMGDFRRAEPLDRQAMEIRRKTLGEEHPDYANNLNNLAALYEAMGDYARAEPLYRQAMEIRRITLGEKHPDYAVSLNNLGYLYSTMGDYARAEPFYRQASEIWRKALGEDHPDYAISLNNLAALHEARRDYARAEPLYLRAMEIAKAAFGEEHPEYATSLNNLGAVYKAMGDYARAEPLYRQAMEIRRITLGEEHPDYAMSLNNLGVLFLSTGDYANAETVCRRAAEIWQSRLGDRHPLYALGLSNLAWLNAARGDWPRAWQRLTEALSVHEHVLQQVFSVSSEPRMRSFLATVSSDYKLLWALEGTPAQRADLVLAWNLRRKAIVFEALCRLRAAQDLLAGDSTVAAHVAQLRRRQQQRNDLILRPPDGATSQQLSVRRTDLEQEIDDLQRQLNRALSERRGDDARGPVAGQAVRAKLPPRSALVEFVMYVPVIFHATGQQSRTGPPRYAALVLHADPAQPITRVELGEASDIDALVDAIAQQIKDAQDWYRGALPSSEIELERSYRQTAAELYLQLFAPVSDVLGEVRDVFLSPDGRLHNLPFEALVDRSGDYLIEQGYRFAYLASGRDLLRPLAALGEGVHVVAAPNYDLDHAQRQRIAAASPDDSPRVDPSGAVALAGTGSLPRQVRSTALRGVADWNELPGALVEGREAAARFDGGPFGKVTLLHGDRALEDTFKRLSRPRVLIAVTHGFFLEDQPQDIPVLDDDQGLLAGPGADATRSGFGAGAGLSRLRGTENPLLRSGLVLAGANTLDQPLPDGIALDDGWLTAEEISQLDLRGTELVVLSACNSSRGQTATDQAVAGLRSAFMFAGARTLVGSLFEVPDRETLELMRDFYTGLCNGGGKLASLQAARQAMIERRRAAHGAAHPFYWASFVLVGEP